jgi:flagellar basal-body rod modification protein FlgD
MSPTMPAGSSTGSGQSSTPPLTATVDKNMFLQLLIAQLRNQDPSKPTDSMQFVQQLAQFQQLEQSINSGQDLSAIRADLDQIVAANSTGAVTQS